MKAWITRCSVHDRLSLIAATMKKTCHVMYPLGLKMGAESWVLVASDLATHGWAHNWMLALLGAAFLLVSSLGVVASVGVASLAHTEACACRSLIQLCLWQVTAVQAGGIRSRRVGNVCGARRHTALCALAWAFAVHAVEATGVSAPVTVQLSKALALPPSPPPPSGKLLPIWPVGRALSGTTFTVRCEGLSSAQCGANLASALLGSEAVLELEDGTYTHSSTFYIRRSVTVRAKNAGRAILDGKNSQRVVDITQATVVIERLAITKGRVSSPLQRFPHADANRWDVLLTCMPRISRTDNGWGLVASGGVRKCVLAF